MTRNKGLLYLYDVYEWLEKYPPVSTVGSATEDLVTSHTNIYIYYLYILISWINCTAG